MWEWVHDCKPVSCSGMQVIVNIMCTVSHFNLCVYNKRFMIAYFLQPHQVPIVSEYFQEVSHLSRLPNTV